jgi:H/ACA ribonucleoprotein complex subunit 2
MTSSDVEMDDFDSPVAQESLASIAKPLAGKKLHKKLLKLVKKATKAKLVKRGVKEVVKAMKKDGKGIVILAGDISPIDVLSHIPVMCEEASIPYAFVRSKSDLGAAGATKRATCCVMVNALNKKNCSESDLVELYEKCAKEVKALL